MENKIFREIEQPFSVTLERLSVIANPDFGLVKSIGRVFQYYDEPKPWQYSASINCKFAQQDGRDFNSVASGISFFSEKHAVFKCLSESIERYCNFAFLKSSIELVNSYKRLKADALDPMSVVSFSKQQLKNRDLRKYIVNKDSIFSWAGGSSLILNKRILLPAQLIYLSYPHLSNESSIYPSTSTGCAGGECLSAALVRGICEIIERDAFMIFYLNKLPANKVQLELIGDNRIKLLLKILKSYKMEVYSFDLTTDIAVPTYLSVVINRTGIGKAVSVGTKCSLNPLGALVGSIEETFNTRTWLRTEYESHFEKVTPDTLLKKSDIKTRGFLWYPKRSISKLNFLLNSSKKKPKVSKNEGYKSSGRQLEQLIYIFKGLGYDVLYKDITLPVFRDMGYFVVKVIIPQMQPFYLNESRKLLGGTRLYDVPRKLGFTKKSEDELNTFPHPLL